MEADKPVTQRQLDKIKEDLDAKMAVLAVSGSTACGTGDSQTTLGERIQQAATNKVLVRVTDAHRLMSTEWLEAASPEVQADWQAAECQQSRLEEKAVQGALNKVMRCQPQTAQFKHKLHDKHNTTSVCGPLKPDVVGCTAGRMLPVNTIILLELKSQKTPYFTAAHLYQVAEYAHNLLNQLPRHRRTKVLTALSDLRSIIFLMVERSPVGGWKYYLDTCRQFEVLPALCAVLAEPAEEWGAGYLPELELCGTPPRSLTILDWLGSGATSDVYKVELRGADDGQALVAKVMRHATKAGDTELLRQFLRQEEEALKAIHSGATASAESLAVPQLVGQLQGRQEGLAGPIQGLVLKPVGVLLSRETLQELQQADVAASIRNLVTALELAYTTHKIAHCDVRLDNLIIVDRLDGALMLSDWGCSRRADTRVAAKDYCGTSKFASDAVLEALADEQPVTAKPADDLESLVKSCFFLTRGRLQADQLLSLDKADYAGILQFWREQLQGKLTWASIIDAARSMDYAAVAESLVAKLE